MYRTSESEPLLAALGCALVAIDPEHGNLLWTVPFQWPVLRIFRIGSRVLVVSSQNVHCLEMEDGRQIGMIDVGFQVEAGILCGDSLVLARAAILGGPDARSMVCLTSDGQIKWRGEMWKADDDRELRLFGPSNELRGQATFPQREAAAGLAFQDVVVQPDFER